MSRQCTLADSTVDLDIVLALPFRPSRVTSAQSGTIQFQTGGDCAGSEIERWAGDKIHKLVNRALTTQTIAQTVIVCLRLQLAVADFLAFE